MNLIVVESKAKTITINKFVGTEYEVDYCSGHLYDLPKNSMGIKINNGFEPIYKPIPGKGAIINKLKESAKNKNKIFLATDPDREGESIAWHLSTRVFNNNSSNVWRITFNEITKSAILDSLKNPRKIDLNLVSAQQARRILDRFVGYEISPILWKKVKKGLSAGRVQSVALRIICEREKEIEKFQAKEYWKIECTLAKKENEEEEFVSTVEKKNNEKIEILDEQTAIQISEELKNNTFKVKSIENKKGTLKPHPPFNTSSLQQEAVKLLGFTVKKTMQIAQQLYEGIEIGTEGPTGLITYIRTDSLRIASTAQEEVRDYIKKNFSIEYLPSTPPTYKSPKSAQEAHEAIRPTSIFREPEKIKKYLNNEQFKLYNLIWHRFLASQMSNAINERKTISIISGEYELTASETKILFDGFLKVYNKITKKEKNDKETFLPKLSENEELTLKNIESVKNLTKPPSRYTEATLVKALEEKGIGRPSTYAPTLVTIQERNYIQKSKNVLYPTKLGMLVYESLIKSFPEILDINFTSKLEEKLDEIERGNIKWQDLVKNFYEAFKKKVEIAKKEFKITETTEQKCDKCGSLMTLKNGRFGLFYACNNFPKCKNTTPFEKNYSEKFSINCPKENCDGKLMKRKTKSKKFFFGCSNYPKCNFVTFYKPTENICPKCNNKVFIKSKNEYICLKEGCEWKGKFN